MVSHEMANSVCKRPRVQEQRNYQFLLNKHSSSWQAIWYIGPTKDTGIFHVSDEKLPEPSRKFKCRQIPREECFGCWED